jgi:hypothetical protein
LIERVKVPHGPFLVRRDLFFKRIDQLLEYLKS